MARKGTRGENDKQPSLFGDGLPEALPPTKGKPRSSRAASPAASPAPSTASATPTAGDGHRLAARLAPLSVWLRKVIAEAAHKLAVKGVIAVMIALIIAAALGFFAVLRFDHTPLLARFHDFVEKQIYAGHRGGPSGPGIETGSTPRSGAPPAPSARTLPLPPSKGQPWIVDVFPERD